MNKSHGKENREIVLGLSLVVYLFFMRALTTWLFRNFGAAFYQAVLAWFILGSPLVIVPIYKDGVAKIGWVIKRWMLYLFAGLLLGAGMSILLYLGSIEMHLTSDIPFGYIFQLLFFSFFVAAMQEETLFRGFIQPKLEERYGRPYGLVLTSLLFGFAHLGFLNFWTSLLAVGLGPIMGYLRDKTKGLPAPFGFHAAFDFIGPTLILISGGVFNLGGIWFRLPIRSWECPRAPPGDESAASGPAVNRAQLWIFPKIRNIT